MKVKLPPPQSRIGLDVSLAIVNIVLLLIFFFLATGQLLNSVDSKVDLAETNDLSLDQLPSPILIVTERGDWELDGQLVAKDLLSVAVDDLPEPRTLHILMDGQAPASDLLELSARPELQDVALRLVTLHRRPGP